MAEIQSLARGLRILELLSVSENGVGVTELAEELGVDKSSASRLMQTLANYGFASWISLIPGSSSVSVWVTKGVST